MTATTHISHMTACCGGLVGARAGRAPGVDRCIDPRRPPVGSPRSAHRALAPHWPSSSVPAPVRCLRGSAAHSA